MEDYKSRDEICINIIPVTFYTKLVFLIENIY